MSIKKDPAELRSHPSDGWRSVHISLTIPLELLKYIDILAIHDYTSRSNILRTALLEYARKPQHRIQIEAEQALAALNDPAANMPGL